MVLTCFEHVAQLESEAGYEIKGMESKKPWEQTHHQMMRLNDLPLKV